MINIRCIVMNTNYEYQFVVKVYNKENKLVDELIIMNGEQIKVNYDNDFKIIVINKYLYPTAILKPINDHDLTFKFYKFCNIPRKITFYLRDSMYDNLIIEKGEINLWPNLIQLI